MSEPSLPDDLSQWPRDPYQLLGVQPGVDERALKKAYTRLIRQYKPEQSPDKFRRIRDAYEVLREQVRWQNGDPEEGGGDLQHLLMSLIDLNNDNLEGVLRGVQEASENAPGAHPETAAQRAEPAELAQLREACQKAREGEVRSAYQGLRSLQDSPARDELYYARLYWMLRLWPQLEPQRHPCRWLTEGMKAQGVTGRLLELYCEHLELEPAEALTARCQHLLTLPCSPWNRLHLIQTRWRAASRLNSLHILAEDLARLRPHYEESYQAWARLLLAAIDVLIWSDDPAVRAMLDECRHELGAFQELNLELADELDQHDLLEAFVESCQRLQHSGRVPPELVALVRDTWLYEFRELRLRLQAALTPLVASPSDGLLLLDTIRSISPVALVRLGELIERLYWELEWEEQPMNDEQRRNLMRLLLAHGINHYGSLRNSLLRWCVSEAVSPHQVSEFLRIQSAGTSMHNLLEDAPLHYLWMAYMAMWS